MSIETGLFSIFHLKKNGCDSSIEMIKVPLNHSTFDFFGNKHTPPEWITQKMNDCKFFCQNKCNTLEIMDDCHSFCGKNRYYTSDNPYKIGCLK